MAQFDTNPPYDTPAWKQLYESAILEPDPSKLAERIAEARRAIHDRAEETRTYSLLAEHRALSSALNILRILEETTAREKPAA
jgi:hypothetical protein